MENGHGAQEVLLHQIKGHKCSPSTERRKKMRINRGSSGLRSWQFSQSFLATTGSQSRETTQTCRLHGSPAGWLWRISAVLRNLWLLKLQLTCSPGNTNIYLPARAGSCSGGFEWAQQGEFTWVRSWEWSIFSLCHPKTQENQNTGDDSSARKSRTLWVIASSSSWDCKLCSLMKEMSGPCSLTAECVPLKWIQAPSRKKQPKKGWGSQQVKHFPVSGSSFYSHWLTKTHRI